MTVIALEDAARKRGQDDARFLSCPDCGAEDFAAVCRFASGKPFIAALLCVQCDPPRETTVVNGFLT